MERNKLFNGNVKKETDTNASLRETTLVPITMVHFKIHFLKTIYYSVHKIHSKVNR